MTSAKTLSPNEVTLRDGVNLEGTLASQPGPGRKKEKGSNVIGLRERLAPLLRPPFTDEGMSGRMA